MRERGFKTRSPQTTRSPHSERGIFSRVTTHPDIRAPSHRDEGHREWWEIAVDGYKLRCDWIGTPTRGS